MRLNLGIALHSGGRYSEAALELESLLKSAPAIEPGYLFLGLSRLASGKPAEAVSPLTRAVRTEPRNTVALLGLGDAHLLSGNPREAADAFARAGDVNPQDPKAWRGLSLSWSAVSQSAFEKLPADSAPQLVLLARSRLAQNEPKAAFGLLKRAIEKDPALPGAHAALGDVYRMTGHPDWAASEDARENRIGRAPEGPYGEALTASAKSLEALRRLAALPDSPELHEVEADAARLRGAFSESVAALRKAVALRPDDRRLEKQLAQSLWLNRDFEGAEPLLRKYGMDFELGYALLETGRAADAIPLLKRGSINPKLAAEASAALGRAYLEAGDPAKAIAPLLAGLESDRDGSIHFQLSRAYQRTGQTALANQMLQRSTELRTQDEALRERIRNQQIAAP
jgi:tetratricopeptide (TPR) repeat protein